MPPEEGDGRTRLFSVVVLHLGPGHAQERSLKIFVTSLMKNNDTYNPCFSSYHDACCKHIQVDVNAGKGIMSLSPTTHDSVSLLVLFVKAHCFERLFGYP